MNASPKRERYLLTQWLALREHGFAPVLLRRARLWILWIVCFLPGMLLPTPYQPYMIGAFLGFVAHNLMTLRASHAFWPVMREFIDWRRVEARITEQH